MEQKDIDRIYELKAQLKELTDKCDHKYPSGNCARYSLIRYYDCAICGKVDAF